MSKHDEKFEKEHNKGQASMDNRAMKKLVRDIYYMFKNTTTVFINEDMQSVINRALPIIKELETEEKEAREKEMNA